MRIVVRVVDTPAFYEYVDPGATQPPGTPGHRFVFSNNIVVERVDNKTPGHGLPPAEQDRAAGTHSGFVTTVRIAAAPDAFFDFPPGPAGVDAYLMEYQGTYEFNEVTRTTPPGTAKVVLRKGQVTARGVLVARLDPTDQHLVPVELFKFAITGGTGPYKMAHGQVTEPYPPGDERHLNIRL
jgi:hypothetical protein